MTQLTDDDVLDRVSRLKASNEPSVSEGNLAALQDLSDEAATFAHKQSLTCPGDLGQWALLN